MTTLNRTRTRESHSVPAAPAAPRQTHLPPEAALLQESDIPATAAPPDARPGQAPPVTRLSAAWISIWASVIVLVALIVFILQNTRSMKVSFIGMNATLPAAMALLIAMAGGIVLTLITGTARIGQLRRLVRRRHN